MTETMVHRRLLATLWIAFMIPVIGGGGALSGNAQPKTPQSQQKSPACVGLTCTDDDDCGRHCKCKNPTGRIAQGKCVARAAPSTTGSSTGSCTSSPDCGVGYQCVNPGGQKGKGKCTKSTPSR